MTLAECSQDGEISRAVISEGTSQLLTASAIAARRPEVLVGFMGERLAALLGVLLHPVHHGLVALALVVEDYAANFTATDTPAFAHKPTR
jgi:hypothetical protein